MMFKKVSILILILFLSCNFKSPTAFSEEALNENLIALDNTALTFKEVINKHRGKKILIDVWASWCRDCIVGMPKVKKLQEQFPEVVFLFLSVDEKANSWKHGVKKYNIKGEHYNLPKGMKKGALVRFLNLGWIPRYLIVDENGKILLFKATDASNKKIKEALKLNI